MDRRRDFVQCVQQFSSGSKYDQIKVVGLIFLNTLYMYRRDVKPSRKGAGVLSTGPMRLFDEKLQQLVLQVEENEKRRSQL